MMNQIRDMRFVAALRNAGAEPYLVGGCVRDSLMGRSPKDIDLLVCNLPAVELEAVLREHGDVDLVGKSFGVYKFVPLGAQDVIDIALPRREKSVGDGHRDFEVEAHHEIPVVEDLARRDFTMNAVAIRLNGGGGAIDPFQGGRDIRARMVRMVTSNSFPEDPLRMLRAVQFAARFGFDLDPATETAMKDHADLVKSVSGERIAGEILKLLTAPKPSVGFRIMARTSLLKLILPEVHALIGVEQPRKHHKYDAFDHVMVVLDAARADKEIERAGEVNLMLSALFHDLGKPPTYTRVGDTVTFHGHQHVSEKLTERIMRRLPFQAANPDVDPTRVLRNVKLHMDLAVSPDEREKLSEKATRRFIARAGGPDGMRELIDLRLADKRGGANPGNIGWIKEYREFVDKFVDRKEPFSVKHMVVKGDDVMAALGIGPSRKVGEVLNALFEKVIEGDLPNERDVLLNAIREMA